MGNCQLLIVQFPISGTLKKKLTKKKINVVMVGGLRQTQQEQCSPMEYQVIEAMP
jgi:hypothetical protein